MVAVAQFLNHVLPKTGRYCAWTRKNGRPFQQFFDTIAELSSFIASADLLGNDVYFGCSGYGSENKREGSNVVSARALWLDLDVKPDRADCYPDIDAALDAAESFLDRVELPDPTVVFSGNGVHLWWVFEEDLPPTQWKTLANNLKNLCKTHGLKADQHRTADIASILRAPGTHNYKNPQAPKEVYCDHLEPPVPVSVFAREIQVLGAPSGVQNLRLAGRADKFTNTYSRSDADLSDGRLVGSRCAQIRGMAASQGNQSEPVWYACLGVLAHCSNGAELAQEWSKGHASYDMVETSKKLDHARTASGPTTCARFKDINPEACQGCPFIVTSPIQLGRTEPVRPASDAKPVQPEPDHVPEPAKESLPELPKPFYWRNRCLTIDITIEDPETGEKSTAPCYLSDFPFFLRSVRKDESTSSRWLEFSMRPHFSPEWEYFVVSSEQASAATARATFNGFGLNINHATFKYFQQYLHAAVENYRRTYMEQIAYNSYGWKNDNRDFLIGTKMLCGDGRIMDVGGVADVEPRTKYFQPPKGAKLENWRRMASSLFAPGWEAQSFTLLASFAAPLMKFVFGEDEGGTILSLVSQESGTGKTTALVAAASVWARLDGVRIVAGDTTKAKIRTLATLSNIPCIFDEAPKMDAAILRQFLQSFTVGRDIQRLTKTGAIQHNYGHWQTVLMTSSNTSMMDILQSDGGDAQSARIFEIYMNPPPNGVMKASKDIAEILDANAGLAGPAFMVSVMRPEFRSFVEQKTKEMVGKYQEKTNASSEYRFVVRLFACVHVASVMLNHLGLLEHDTQRIMDFAVDVLLGRQDDQFQSMEVKGDATLRGIMTEIHEHTLYVRDKYNPNVPTDILDPMPRRKVVARLEVKPGKLYVLCEEARRAIVKQSRNFRATVKYLKEKGILTNPNRLTTLTAGSNFPPIKGYCWELDLTKTDVSKITAPDIQETVSKVVALRYNKP